MNMKKLKRKKLGKSLAISGLATLLLLSGCGGSDEPADSQDGKLTLNFLTQSSPLAPADPNDKLIFKRLEEKTGIHIQWKTTPMMCLLRNGI